MDELVCVYASGMFVRDICKELIEKNLVVHADMHDNCRMYLKKDKVKLRNENSVMIFADKTNLEEITNYIKQGIKRFNEPIFAYTLPVINNII